MKMSFSDMEPCSLVEEDRRIRGAIALMMEAVCTSETSVFFCETTRSHIAEGCHLQIRRRANLKSHNIMTM
jgi:hypothetical protein